MKDDAVERRVGGMAVAFPTAIGQVELDGAADRIAAVDSNRGVGKIRAGFAVPGAELDDVDLIAGDGSKAPPEITREPAGLELEFARSAQRGEEGALVD